MAAVLRSRRCRGVYGLQALLGRSIRIRQAIPAHYRLSVAEQALGMLAHASVETLSSRADARACGRVRRMLKHQRPEWARRAGQDHRIRRAWQCRAPHPAASSRACSACACCWLTILSLATPTWRGVGVEKSNVGSLLSRCRLPCVSVH